MKPGANFKDLKRIDCEVKRKCTLTKRKRGLFKKVIELSQLCGVDIFICIFDRERQKIFELNSEPEFDVQIVSHMLEKVNKEQFKCKKYTNQDYNTFKNENRIEGLPESEFDSDFHDDNPLNQKDMAKENEA